MCALNIQDQGLITLSQQNYLPIMFESFLIDRRSQGLCPDTIEPIQIEGIHQLLKTCQGELFRSP